MAINYNTVTKRIFDILVGSDYEVLMGDENAKKTLDSTQAVRFYVQDLHSMVFVDKKEDKIKLYVSNGEDADSIEKLKNAIQKTADHFMLGFTVKNYGKKLEPKDFAFQVAVQESANMTGTTKSSYQNLNGGKLIIRHTKSINAESRGSRSRSIKSIYVENKDGERFQFHTKWLTGARAMARHVGNGGYPHDEVGTTIKSLSEEYSALRKFIRHANVKGFVNEETQGLVEFAQKKTIAIERAMRRMNFEGLTVNLAEADNDRAEQIKNSFTQHITSQAVESALPYLQQLVLEKEAMDISHEALRNVEDVVQRTPKFEVIDMDRNDHDNPINLNFSDNDTAIKHTAKYMRDHIVDQQTKDAIDNALNHYDRWEQDQKDQFNQIVRNMIRKVVRINKEQTQVPVDLEVFESIKKTAMDFKIERILSK